MSRQIPNLLTAVRFFMAIGFFVVLGFYDGGREAGWPVLDVATAVFLVAVATDAVDGYLARKLGHLSKFGRVADPFVDKIIVCGALVYFISGPLAGVSGWQAWMVVLIIARELLVTGMRAFSESHDIAFAASWSGKVKMILQCVAITWVLIYAGHFAAADPPAWTYVGRDVWIWAATLFTGVSGLLYVKRAYELLKAPID